MSRPYDKLRDIGKIDLYEIEGKRVSTLCRAVRDETVTVGWHVDDHDWFWPRWLLAALIRGLLAHDPTYKTMTFAQFAAESQELDFYDT